MGASGAILAMVGMFASVMPEAKLQIVFLPLVSFSAWQGLLGLMAVDTVGLLAGWRLFDHAAHLSGALFGVWWATHGNKYFWQERRGPLYMLWHKYVRGEGRN